MRRRLVVRLVGAGTLGFLLSAGTSCSAPTAPDGPIAITRFPADMFDSFVDGPATARQVIVRNVTDWQNIWNDIHWRRNSVPPLPTIDFTKEMVAVGALGERRNTNGNSGLILHHARIPSASRFQGVLTVSLEESRGMGCSAPTVLYPFDAVRLPVSNDEVQFKLFVVTSQCSFPFVR